MRLDFLVKSPEHGMSFTDEELSARFQQARDHGSPLSDIGEPADGADACEDHVERCRGEDFQGVVGRCFNEGELLATGCFSCETLAFFDGGG